MARVNKAPSDSFYWQDWARDLEEHPLEIEGAWIRICCKLWFSETRGRLSRTLEQWGRILRVPPERAEYILGYIGDENIGTVTFCHKNVTVECRRMRRAAKASENNSLRQRRFRAKEQSNAHVTEAAPLPSSSPSPSSSKDLKAEPPEAGGPSPNRKSKARRPTTQEQEELGRLMAFFEARTMRNPGFDFNAAQFLRARIDKPPQVAIAALLALERAVKAGTPFRRGPWAYATDVFDKELQQYNARLSEGEHEKRKKGGDVPIQIHMLAAGLS